MKEAKSQRNPPSKLGEICERKRETKVVRSLSLSSHHMRIRKQLAFSSSPVVISCTQRNLQTEVCELNRSPWDAMTFTSEFHFPPTKQDQAADEGPVLEFECGEESFGVISRQGLVKEEVKEDCFEENRFCNKKGWRGWKCSKEAKHGYSLCDYHLEQLRSYHYQSRQKSQKITNSRGRNTKGSLSPVSDFFYYSGFGPLWSKKRRRSDVDGSTIASSCHDTHDSVDENAITDGPIRGKKSRVKKENGRGEKNINGGTLRLSSPNHDNFCNHHDHDADVDENGIDDDEEDVEYRRKKGRKPMKSRSLKSLL